MYVIRRGSFEPTLTLQGFRSCLFPSGSPERGIARSNRRFRPGSLGFKNSVDTRHRRGFVYWSGNKKPTPPMEVKTMTRTELAGAIVRIKTKDEYDGMLGKICGAEDEGEMLVVKHRPIRCPQRRDSTMHCFRKDELEIIKT